LIAVNFPRRQEGAVNKSELVQAVATGTGLEKRQAEAAVGVVVEEIMTRARSGETVSIFGFGSFKPTARKARTGRNPRTGAAVKIAASKSVKFQPATAFKAVLNSKKAAAKKTATKKTATKKTAATKTTATKAVPAKRALPAKVAKKATPAKKTTAARKATVAKKTTASAKRR
jgi:DNA-binding protein HU-beta